MAKYRKRPVMVEAVQISKQMEIPPWLNEAMRKDTVLLHVSDQPFVYIKTLEGIMRGKMGDWIIRGIKGEIYVCDEEVFAASYDPA